MKYRLELVLEGPEAQNYDSTDGNKVFSKKAGDVHTEIQKCLESLKAAGYTLEANALYMEPGIRDRQCVDTWRGGPSDTVVDRRCTF